jgi:biopolymer transport protein ExbB/TolQ
MIFKDFHMHRFLKYIWPHFSTPTFWLSAPIGLCSILLFALACERLRAFRRRRLRPRPVVEAMDNLKRGLIPEQDGNRKFANGKPGPLEVAKGNPGPLANLLLESLRLAGRPTAEVLAALQATALRELAQLAIWNDSLALAGRLGPLLGLLGTVMFLILATPAAASGPGPKAPGLAGGLSHGLYPMCAGVVLAIVGEALAGFFGHRLKSYAVYLGKQLPELAEKIALLPRDQPYFPSRATTDRRAPCSCSDRRGPDADTEDCSVSITTDVVGRPDVRILALSHSPINNRNP